MFRFDLLRCHCNIGVFQELELESFAVAVTPEFGMRDMHHDVTSGCERCGFAFVGCETEVQMQNAALGCNAEILLILDDGRSLLFTFCFLALCVNDLKLALSRM